jgi:hypothetical protein
VWAFRPRSHSSEGTRTEEELGSQAGGSRLQCVPLATYPTPISLPRRAVPELPPRTLGAEDERQHAPRLLVLGYLVNVVGTQIGLPADHTSPSRDPLVEVVSLILSCVRLFDAGTPSSMIARRIGFAARPITSAAYATLRNPSGRPSRRPWSDGSPG